MTQTALQAMPLDKEFVYFEEIFCSLNYNSYDDNPSDQELFP